MIWGIQSSQPSNVSGSANAVLPDLVPLINNSSSSTGTAARGIAAAAANQATYLDVVKNFYWTYSKPESRDEVPSIYLKEKRLKVNAIVSQLKYSLGFAAAEASDAVSKLNSLITNVGGKNFFTDIATSLTSGAVEVGQNLSDAISSLIPADDNATLRTSPALRPYRGLYITEPTRWEFLLPYFDDKFETQGNQFSSEGVTNALGGIIQTGANIATEVAEISRSLLNPTSITYIERAKFFNFPTDGEEITFSFPLINTGSLDYNDVINNWQLIFLLLYNNKPGRLSPTLVEQPVIYEVEIPGVKYLPFCYISTIDIKFQGSRRELPISIPYAEQQSGFNAAGQAIDLQNVTETKTINTIVPDAYLVTITLKSMLGGTKNFMYHMINSGDITTVGTR
jgi:hypothetical protein